MTKVLLNSTKIKPRQHILAVPLVTSPGIIRSEIHLRSVNEKVQKEQKSDKKYSKDYMRSTCISSDYGENMCKVPKRLV